MLNCSAVQSERGAAAVLVAAALLALVGFAAVAVDLGMGFNERRQDQTASDSGVLAGAVGFALGEGTSENVSSVLSYARQNLPTTYNDGDWEALWEACTDPDRVAFDLGDGTFANFSPLPKPAAWGSGTLDCISSGSSYIRVRMPNQEVATTFARIWGIQSLETNAAAVARIEPASGSGPLLPSGIPGGTANGEVCLSSSSTGTSLDPCTGPSSGAFGEINSEFFGDYIGAPDCGNPGFPELRQNIALGLDHFVGVWDGDTNGDGLADVSLGDAHPGDASITSYYSISRDACKLTGTTIEPEFAGEAFPANTVLVDTGNSGTDAVRDGLISNMTFLGQPSRLQQVAGATSTRHLINQNETYTDVDNTGPWEFLVGPSGSECDGSTYSNSGLDPQEKRLRFNDCLSSYSGTADIFSTGIDDSTRFAWVPQYWFDAGKSWQPVHSYRMAYIAGLGFNCSASKGCDVFYPDGEDESDFCVANGAGKCKKLKLDQMSGWLLPDEAVPDSIRNAFPGGQSPFEATLFR